jgi:hypothetical protein
VFVVFAGLAALGLIAFLVRRRRAPVPQEPHAFTRAEIASYDHALPKYLLAAATSLLLGGTYLLAAELPAVRHWLAGAGDPSYRLLADATQQCTFVGGAVMLAMGLTCYSLPRLIGRPLRDHTLARLSFVLTLAGAALTILTETVLALVAGSLGQASALTAWPGPWEAALLWLAQALRDCGYLTFALLILLTVLSGRHVIWPAHRRCLTRWLLAAAAALVVVVTQRWLAVWPGPPTILSPIASAQRLDVQGANHLQLAAALLPIATATFVYLLERKAERRPDWDLASHTLAALATGLTLFYLVRAGLALYEDYFAPRTGLPSDIAVLALGAWRPFLLAGSALVLFFSLLPYLSYVGQLTRRARLYLPWPITGTLGVGLGLAFVAGLHGALLPLLSPGSAATATSIAHGTLAFGGLLLLPALTLADCLLLDAAGASAGASLAQAGLGFLAGGIVLGYLARLGLGGPAAALTAAALQMAGFITFALHTYQATARYRRALPARLRLPTVKLGSRGANSDLLELPASQMLLIELLAGLAGFPGFGWLFAGFTLIGSILLYAGPAIAWALLPAFVALSKGWLHQVGWNILLVYLPATAAASTLFLNARLRGKQSRPAA